MQPFITRPTDHQRRNGATHEIDVCPTREEAFVNNSRSIVNKILRRAKKWDVRVHKWQWRVIIHEQISREELEFWLYANFPDLKPQGRK